MGCYICQKDFESSNLKTTRSRFRIMGLQPPIGMGQNDKVCGTCLNKIYKEELQRIKISQVKRDLQLN